MQQLFDDASFELGAQGEVKTVDAFDDQGKSGALEVAGETATLAGVVLMAQQVEGEV